MITLCTLSLLPFAPRAERAAGIFSAPSVGSAVSGQRSGDAMKRYGSLFEEVCSFEDFVTAAYQAPREMCRVMVYLRRYGGMGGHRSWNSD